MKQYIILLVAVAGLSGCATVSERFGIGKRSAAQPPMTAAIGVPAASTVAETALAPATAAPPPPPTAKTAEALDTTTPEQRAAASVPPPQGARVLGKTVVSLGSATEPGLWMKTPLVKTEVQGSVTNPASGKSSTVRLIPIEGPATAGSRMSLAALRLIGASLTDLTTVVVSTGG